jgi:hypothetical protein
MKVRFSAEQPLEDAHRLYGTATTNLPRAIKKGLWNTYAAKTNEYAQPHVSSVCANLLTRIVELYNICCSVSEGPGPIDGWKRVNSDDQLANIGGTISEFVATKQNRLGLYYLTLRKILPDSVPILTPYHTTVVPKSSHKSLARMTWNKTQRVYSRHTSMEICRDTEDVL